MKAKKSMDKFWIGMFARWFNSIPVQRPQDLKKPAVGKIYLESLSNPLVISGSNSRAHNRQVT